MTGRKPNPSGLDVTLPRFNAKPEEVSATVDPLVGSHLKHFEITSLLGRGGMGAVYLGRDTSLDRPVAIKVLAPEIGIDAEMVERFGREARAQAQLGHANITQIYFIGQDRGLHFFAMEYIDGTFLETILADGKVVSWERALDIGISTARGLKAALAKGFIHRDVKPSNLLVDKDAQVKIADFGLAKQVRGDSQLTQAGVIVGSPLYMAPEQGRAEAVDHRADIYSLGCTLYHLIAGQPPFDHPSPVAVMSMHVTDRATRLRALKPDVPEAVERLVDRMMAKNMADRFDGYDELLAALEAALPGRREYSGFWMRGMALGIDIALLSLIAIVFGVWFLFLAVPYFVLSWKLRGQTLGTWVLRLQISDSDGKRLRWKATAIRFAIFAWGPIAWLLMATIVYWMHRNTQVSFTLSQLKWTHLWQPLVYIGISAAIFLGYLGGFLLAAFHPKKLALHDLIAHTEVTIN